jgi:CheY-like chemotaxis protein
MLPLQTADSTSANAITPGRNELQHCRLILVDNSAEYLRLMQNQAAPWGVTVDTASTSAEALQLIGAHLGAHSKQFYSHTVLVINHRLKEGEALDLLLQLETHQLLTNCPRLLISPAGSEPSEQAMLSLQVDGIIQKPVMWKQLREAVLDTLHRADAPTPQHRPTHPLPHSAKRTVLVVEDNRVNQLVASRMLTKIGVPHQLAGNGEEALRILQQDYDLYDAVLMDCEMPVMDGYEATRKLRQWETQNRRQHKPVIAVTAHVLNEHKVRAQAAGMDDFICKPISCDELEDKLEALFGPAEHLPATSTT